MMRSAHLSAATANGAEATALPIECHAGWVRAGELDTAARQELAATAFALRAHQLPAYSVI